MKFLLYFLLSLIGLWVVYQSQEADFASTEKMNGVSLVNPHFQIDSSHMRTVHRVNANWVAVIPYAFSKENEPQVYFNHDRQWWGEREEGSEVIIKLAHQEGLNVMLKPHVWMHGNWIGDYDLQTEEDWQIWESDYANYILTFAKMADRMGVELFCIGTELKIAAHKRPEFWKKLIVKIKEEYHGKLTYAANWDNYENITFWEDLDYIGIDAYFPLVEKQHAEIPELIEAWKPIKEEIKSLSRRLDMPVIFTEYGYQSLNGAAGNHWEVIHGDDQLNYEIQSNAYQVLFDVFWEEVWFAGGFLWKWHFGEARHAHYDTFTPQGKPAENVIARHYAEN